MKFDDTPTELRKLALAVTKWPKTPKLKWSAEKALEDAAPLRTTLIGRRGAESFLIEVQSRPHFGSALQSLARWLNQERKFARLSIAVPSSVDIPGALPHEAQTYGVGVIVVDMNTGSIIELQRAQTFSLLVPPLPSVALGPLKAKVCGLCRRFNEGDRRDALRDAFELVEGETGNLGKKVAKKGWIDKDETTFEGLDWNNQINVLASVNRYQGHRAPLIDSKLKDDLHSFRGARNLFDHPPRTVAAANRRDHQSQERMIQGPRLLSELLRLKRSVR